MSDLYNYTFISEINNIEILFNFNHTLFLKLVQLMFCLFLMFTICEV